jgi:hypothetical protein
MTRSRRSSAHPTSSRPTALSCCSSSPDLRQLESRSLRTGRRAG